MPIYKTDKKKDGVQQYKVVVNYTDAKGDYRQKTRLVYGKAEASLMEMRLNHEIGENTPSKSLTINLLFDEYIEAKKHEVRESSLEKTISILTRYVLATLATNKLKNIDSPALQKWKNDINEKDLSLTTKNNIYNEFHSLLNYAMRMDYIARNPLDLIGRFKDSLNFAKPQDVLHYYTANEFKTFITYAGTHCNTFKEWGYYVFFNIAFYTGMRKGEINALKWSDIDGNIIHVRRSVSQRKKGISVVETPPKTKSSYRDLQMPQQLMAVLKEHKERQTESELFTNDFRICGGDKCLSDTSISDYNIKWATACNLPHIRIHDFRHTHASLLINEGINVQEIARRLGHSSVEQTWNTYAHLYPREEERAIKILENLSF